MRIYPCNTFHIQPNYALQLNKCSKQSPTFTSELDDIERPYDDYEIEIAKKYVHVKDFANLVKEEIGWNIFSASTVCNVYDLIGKYRQYEISQKNKLRDLTQAVDILKQKSVDIENHNAKITYELNKANMRTALEKIRINKAINQEKRKKQVFEELESKYISLQKLEEKSYPNAIMIKGMDNKNEQEEVIKYLQKNGCEVFKLNFDNFPVSVAHNEINTCAKNIKSGGKHSIILIENFDKYTVPTDENDDFISRLKGFLCSCSKKYDTTILVFESHPEKLDENIIGGHRFQKQIDVRKFNTGEICEFMPKYDGYTMYYNDDENSCVDLYLGDFGANEYTLWIDSDDPKKIKNALDRIDKIRKIDRFKNTIFIKSPCPTSLNELYCYWVEPEDKFTADYKRIYSYMI